MKVTMNLRDHFRVKLTPMGKEAWRAFHEDKGILVPETDVLVRSLWDLMAAFGGYEEEVFENCELQVAKVEVL